MHQSVSTAARELAHNWVDTVALVDLFLYLPSEIFEAPLVSKSSTPATAALKIKSVRRMPRRLNHVLTPEEGNMIREQLGALESGTPEFEEKRRQLCRELRVTVRQAHGALRWAGKHRVSGSVSTAETAS